MARLQRLLSAEPPALRVRAVRALAAHGAAAVEALDRALGDRDLRVGIAAVEALGTIGGRRAAAVLGAALTRDPPCARGWSGCFPVAGVVAIVLLATGSGLAIAAGFIGFFGGMLGLWVLNRLVEERTAPYYTAIAQALARIAERDAALEASAHLPTLRLRTMLGKDWADAADAIERIEIASDKLKNLPIAVETLTDAVSTSRSR